MKKKKKIQKYIYIFDSVRTKEIKKTILSTLFMAAVRFTAIKLPTAAHSCTFKPGQLELHFMMNLLML